MATDLEQLVASFDADITKFEKKLDKMGVQFDKVNSLLTQKQDKFVRSMNSKLGEIGGNFVGLDKVKAAFVGLTAAGIIGGLADLVKKSLDAAAAVGEIATQAGVSTDFLQKIRFAGSQTGATFGDMDNALISLNRNLGVFVQTGGGRAATVFKSIGLDKAINSGAVRDTQQAFDYIIKSTTKYQSEAQKAAILSAAMGQEIGPKLLGLANEGADGLAKLEAQAASLNLVLSDKTIQGAKEAKDKLGALFAVLEAEGVNAIAQLAPKIGDLAQRIIEGLPQLITWVEKWAEWFGLIKESPLEALNKQITTIQDRLKVIPNSPWNKGAIDDYTKRLAVLQAQRDKLVAVPPAAATPSTPKPVLHVAQTDAEKAAAARLQAQRVEAATALAQTIADKKTADAAVLVAQDRTNVQLLKGTSDYHAAVIKQIDDEYNESVARAEDETAKRIGELDKQKAALKKQGSDWQGYADAVANVNATLTDKIAAAAEERKQKLDEANGGPLVREAIQQGAEQIQTYKDETDAIGLMAGAAARLAVIQNALNEAKREGITLSEAQMQAIIKEADAVGQAAQVADGARRIKERDIQATDELRQGLEDVGVAALKGFGGLKDAAAEFLQQMAEMILRLYVLKPLIESVLGPAGTTGPSVGGGGGGGIVGSAISSASSWITKILGFANGGVMTPQGPRYLKKFAGGGTSDQAAIFGEAGPEAAVPLPDGRSIPVALRMPKMPSVPQRAMASSSTVFDLRGAVVTQDLLDQVNNISQRHAANEANKAVVLYDRTALPARVAKLRGDPRRR